MQLIQRQTLVYQGGRSEKVYEVDLCQVAHERYVVNDRYGKRGGTLKEGSQTPSALSLPAAQSVFDKLVAAKRAKGYREVGQAAPPLKPPAPQFTSEASGRDRYLLERLATAVQNPQTLQIPRQWPLDRVIWRVGELQISSAAPFLIQLWGSSPLRNYSIAWALGKCGDPQVVSFLEQVYRDTHNSAQVRRISLEAIFKLSAAKKAELTGELMTQLPPGFRLAITGQVSAPVLLEQLKQYLGQGTPDQFSVLTLLYQIDQEVSHQAILELLSEIPFGPNYFQQIRWIFKIAEYRQDALVIAILTYRFDREQPFYNSDSYYLSLDGVRTHRPRRITIKNWRQDPQTRKYHGIRTSQFQQEISSVDSRLAYGSATRDYFRRRVWRSLQALGAASQLAYVDLAVEILLQYCDQDAIATREVVRYRYDRQTWQRLESSRAIWDAYGRYLTFNHILYTNSPRYELRSGTQNWRCKKGFRPGDALPAVREEAFPHLWQQQPAALLRLLCTSRCRPVHEFAAKAIASCPDFCQTLPIDTLLQLLAQPYEVTAQLGFELARTRYQPEQPQPDLILAIANCAYAPARQAAHQWLSTQMERFLQDDMLITGLVLSSQPDTQQFIRQALSSTIVPIALAQKLIVRIVAGLLAFSMEQGTIAEIAADTLVSCFQIQLRGIGLAVILDLLRHPLPALQTAGARILLACQTPVIDLPAGLIDALIESPISAVRTIGVQLFGQLPDELLVGRLDLILSFITHELPEMRQAILPCLRRLGVDPDFSTQLVDRLLPCFRVSESAEGLHRFISRLLQTEIPQWMAVASPATAWMLLSAEATFAQDLAGRVLQVNSDRWATTLSTERIAALTHHEMLAVRKAGWQMLDAIQPRLRQNAEDLLTATMVLAAPWPDSRDYGFRLFGEQLQPSELTPAVVISICDSNREDVRRFGRDLVGKCFQAQDGWEYLLKFSEHPATDMQLFASQYLEDYGAGHPDRLAELMPYFSRVLGQVNRARVVKERIFNFLNAEASKSPIAAQVVVELLTQQSASIAIGERARSLELLLKIHQLYPALAVPIKVSAIALKP